MGWIKTSSIGSRSYICGYCGERIASDEGYYRDDMLQPKIYICHHCGKPTFFDSNNAQYPGFMYGNEVSYITDEPVELLYNEARRCIACSAYTASVLCSRKLLMNIAVAKGAKEGLKFIDYVNYLADSGYIPPDGKQWVDYIRTKGNEATHEIAIMSFEDATDLIGFSEMLLKFIYEFPAILKQKSKD